MIPQNKGNLSKNKHYYMNDCGASVVVMVGMEMERKRYRWMDGRMEGRKL